MDGDDVRCDVCGVLVQMVEKSEYRSQGAQAVGMLTTQMETKDYARFIKWLSNLSRSAKVKLSGD